MAVVALSLKRFNLWHIPNDHSGTALSFQRKKITISWFYKMINLIWFPKNFNGKNIGSFWDVLICRLMCSHSEWWCGNFLLEKNHMQTYTMEPSSVMSFSILLGLIQELFFIQSVISIASKSRMMRQIRQGHWWCKWI